MMKNNKNIQIIIAVILLFLSILLYLVFHGTENLIVVEKINSVLHLIPVFSGIKIKISLFNGYLVDILWFTSLILLSPLFPFISNYANSILALLLAILLELCQLVLPKLGTFDIYDIICYFAVFCLYNLFLVLLRNKRKN